MKKTLIGILIAVVVVAAILLGGPGLVGRGAENALKTTLVAMSRPGLYRIEVTDYQRGWYSAQATSTFILEGELAKSYSQNLAEQGLPPEAFEITFQHRLSHGPLLMTDHGPKLALAYATTDMNPPPILALLLLAYLEGKPLFTFETTFDFGGTATTDVHNPAFTGQLPRGGDIRWDGITGEVRTRSGEIEYALTAPKLRVEMPDRLYDFVHVKTKGHLVRHGRFLQIGTTEFEFPEIRLISLDGGELEIDALTYRVETELDEDGLLDFTGELRVAGTQMEGARVLGETALSFALSDMSAEGLDHMVGLYRNAIRTRGQEAEERSALDQLLREGLEPVFSGPVTFEAELVIDADFSDTALAGNTSVRISGEDDGLRLVANQRLQTLRSRDLNLTDSAAKLTLSGMNGGALTDAYREVVEAIARGLPPGEQGEQLRSSYARHLPKLLDEETELTLDHLILNVPDGTATATGAVRFQRDGPLDLAVPGALIGRLDGSFSATVSEGALLWALSRQSLGAIRTSLQGAGRSVTRDAVEQLALTAARGRLTCLLAQALVRRKGDDLVLEADLKNGVLLMNGVRRPDRACP